MRTTVNSLQTLTDEDRVAALEQIARDIRVMIIETTHRAGCGHTGGSFSAVELLTSLYFDVMKIEPEHPHWEDRDRFILSKGHCTPVYYATLAKRGYFAEEVLETFDQLGSILQAHPDMRKTPGVDMSTGSLGQGLSVGIGMALGGMRNGQDFWTYVLLGCGEIQEGQVWEAAMYGGTHQVQRLIAVVDYNRVQLSDTMDQVLSSHPIVDKWRAFNWSVMECDGHSIREIIETLYAAKQESRRPVVVIAHTVKGKGVTFMENRYEWHGRAPNDQEAERAMKEILST